MQAAGARGVRGPSGAYGQRLRAGLALRAASAGHATPEQAAIGTGVVDPEGAAARDDRALAKLAVGGFQGEPQRRQRLGECRDEGRRALAMPLVVALHAKQHGARLQGQRLVRGHGHRQEVASLKRDVGAERPRWRKGLTQSSKGQDGKGRPGVLAQGPCGGLLRTRRALAVIDEERVQAAAPAALVQERGAFDPAA